MFRRLYPAVRTVSVLVLTSMLVSKIAVELGDASIPGRPAPHAERIAHLFVN